MVFCDIHYFLSHFKICICFSRIYLRASARKFLFLNIEVSSCFSIVPKILFLGRWKSASKFEIKKKKLAKAQRKRYTLEFGKNWSRTQVMGWEMKNVKFEEKLLKNERKLLRSHFSAFRLDNIFNIFMNLMGMV